MPDPVDGVLDQATLDALVDSLGGDVEFLAELIDTWLTDAPAQVAALREALVAGDVAALVRPAHTLKSSSASLAAFRLAEQCRELEASARAGSLDGAVSAVDAIAAESTRVAEAFDQVKQDKST